MKLKMLFIATFLGMVSSFAFANETELACVSKTSKIMCENYYSSNYASYSNAHITSVCKASVFGLDSEGKQIEKTKIGQDINFVPFDSSNLRLQYLTFATERSAKNKLQKELDANKDELGQCSDN
jgi:hypothetical protein